MAHCHILHRTAEIRSAALAEVGPRLQTSPLLGRQKISSGEKKNSTPNFSQWNLAPWNDFSIQGFCLKIFWMLFIPKSQMIDHFVPRKISWRSTVHSWQPGWLLVQARDATSWKIYKNILNFPSLGSSISSIVACFSASLQPSSTPIFGDHHFFHVSLGESVSSMAGLATGFFADALEGPEAQALAAWHQHVLFMGLMRW